MPKYEIIDFSGVWCWVRQSDGTYLVDKNSVNDFEKMWEFLKL